MSQPNWIQIKDNQKATYKVKSSFPYYLQMGSGSTVIFESLNGGQVTIEKNIWGPGNVTINCSAVFKSDFGVAPGPGILTANAF